MTPEKLPTFTEARELIKYLFYKHGRDVHTEKWQGVDISKRPEAKMKELLGITFTVPLLGVELLDHWRSDIKPNLPWADRHFDERVCGQPINPGIEWANWPWGSSAERFREPSVRVMGKDDWAYLAGIIDGEGLLDIRTTNGDKACPRIKITQVDEAFLRQLYEKWGVGTFREYRGEDIQLSSRQSYIWRISSKAEVRWILDGCLPYLRLKRGRALECLGYIDPKETMYNDQPRFNHNYMTRYWPKFAGRDEERPNFGIYNSYGDLDDLVDLLVEQPDTRQAWLPIFFPEDTGIGDGGRKPCSLGYHFLMRNNKLNVYYPLRSCDFAMHWADDCYLTVRLLLWVLDECRKRSDRWLEVQPGEYSMYCGSLHVFTNEYRKMMGGR